MTIAQKTCGSCSLCCKLVAVPDLDKPAHQWCVHNRPGRGCAIHGSHPDVCKTWQCGWILMPQLDALWKPEACGFILRNRYGSQQLVVDVDPAKPDVWRKEPFHSRIRGWARSSRATGQHVMVCVGRREFAIFAQEEIDVGVLQPGETALMTYQDQGVFTRPVVLVRNAEGGRVREAVGRFHPKTSA